MKDDGCLDTSINGKYKENWTGLGYDLELELREVVHWLDSGSKIKVAIKKNTYTHIGLIVTPLTEQGKNSAKASWWDKWRVLRP